MSNELNQLNFIEGKNKLISNVTAKEISNTAQVEFSVSLLCKIAEEWGIPLESGFCVTNFSFSRIS